LATVRRDHRGLAVLPSWAAATPVAVLSDTVPAEFILPETNGWVVPDDADALATVIAGALSQPEQTAWMGRNGRVAAETAFTWEGAAGKLLAAASRKRALSPEGKVRGGT
ncbi:MAG: hypothetical protein LIP77_09945, partial [Planctomycetes bacterium]|nr:hypothetical protein [Planctomycetota bacterium]